MSPESKTALEDRFVEGGWVAPAPAPAELRRPTKFDRQKTLVRGWLPEYLRGAGVITPKCPRCKSNDRVTVKEWVSRRVVVTHDCYGLVDITYQCGNVQISDPLGVAVTAGACSFGQYSHSRATLSVGMENHYGNIQDRLIMTSPPAARRVAVQTRGRGDGGRV